MSKIEQVIGIRTCSRANRLHITFHPHDLLEELNDAVLAS